MDKLFITSAFFLSQGVVFLLVSDPAVITEVNLNKKLIILNIFILG